MELGDIEKQYARFSGLIHFLDISLESEETPLGLDLSRYVYVFEFLDQNQEITVQQLSDLFENSPESIHIFELILQLSNFTAAQRTYLMFDLDLVNSSNVDDSVGYILKELTQDIDLRSQAKKDGILSSDSVPKLEKLDPDEKYELLAELKKLIAKQSKKKGSKVLQNRLRISEETRLRVAKYIIENRSLNDILQGIRPREFIANKRIPHDTKSAHGKYSVRMLERILKSAGFKHDLSGSCSEKMIERVEVIQESLDEAEGTFSYCMEKEVESIVQPGSSISSESVSKGAQVSKRFDFVLLFRNEPRVVVETNFYTTSGSKIGINEKEYLSLHRKIAEAKEGLRFIWVTDGSYWLTGTGRRSFTRLVPTFQDDLKNLAMFSEDMKEIKDGMK